MSDKQVFEKCCSRCGRINWDRQTGVYGEICTKDGKKCDTNGTQIDDDGNIM